jgi:hypothetical protein
MFLNIQKQANKLVFTLIRDHVIFFISSRVSPLTNDKVRTNPFIFQSFYFHSRRQTHSVCLEETIKMLLEAGIPLAAEYVSETVACEGNFRQ